MKDIRNQRTHLDQRKPSPFGKLLEFLKFKKSILDSQKVGESNDNELKIKWEDKVFQKKLEIDEAKKNWDAKRKETLNQPEPLDSSELTADQSKIESLDSSELTADQSKIESLDSSELTADQSKIESLDSIAQDSELVNQISDNALSPYIFRQSAKQTEQKE